MHEKKFKGDVGVGHVIARLLDLGWNVGVPISEHARYDLFAEKDCVVHTVQVKYSALKSGRAEVNLSNTWADKNGNHIRTREKGDYTVLAVYIPDNGVCFLKEEDFADCHRSVNLRLEAAKNGQSKGIRLAEDFRELE